MPQHETSEIPVPPGKIGEPRLRIPMIDKNAANRLARALRDRGVVALPISRVGLAKPGNCRNQAIRLPLAHPFRANLRRVTDPQLQSSAPLAVVQTSARVHWLPSPRGPSFLAPPNYGRTSPLPRDALVGPVAYPYRCPQKQFAPSSGDNRILAINIVGSFLPSVGWFAHHQSLLGRGSRHCHGINFTH